MQFILIIVFILQEIISCFDSKDTHSIHMEFLSSLYIKQLWLKIREFDH